MKIINVFFHVHLFNIKRYGLWRAHDQNLDALTTRVFQSGINYSTASREINVVAFPRIQRIIMIRLRIEREPSN